MLRKFGLLIVQFVLDLREMRKRDRTAYGNNGPRSKTPGKNQGAKHVTCDSHTILKSLPRLRVRRRPRILPFGEFR